MFPYFHLTIEGLSMFSVRLKHMLLASAVMLGSLGGVVTAQTADTKVLSSQILPKDTFFYMSMPSVTRFAEEFSKSSAGRLWADPSLDEFKTQVQDAFASAMEEDFTKVNEALGLTVDQLLAIPTGEVALAFSKAPPNKMGAILFFDYGSHESDVSILLDKAAAGLRGMRELESSTVEHDGTELVMFTVTAPIARKTPLAKEFGWFLKDERLVISNSSALLKLTLDNWDGSAQKTLIHNDVFSYIMEKCETEPGSSLMTTFVDPVGLFTQLVQTGSLGEAGLAAGMGISFLPVLGVNQLKGIGSVGEMGGEDFEGVNRSFLYCEQPAQAAMQVFQLDAVDQVPPKWVKEGASAWMATSWKIGEAYLAVEGLVDMFQAPGTFARIINDMSSQGPGVHIKNDIIDQLDGKLQLAMAPGDPEASGADDVLISLGIKDAKKFANLLSKLSSQPGISGNVQTRELNGVTIYEIEPPTGAKIVFTVANNQLLFGVGGNQLEQAVRNDDDVRPLSESKDFQAVAEHFPKGALLVSFTRPANQYQRLYDSLRDGEAADSFPGMDEFFSKIDFSKLPPFEVIEKYMAPSGSYWIGDENGVFMEQFSLNTEE